ncbi:MAG TPA: 2-dehydropantoate 2-reductase [Blastocatellia bacterium]|nr:2-dehydropantoate 2-reductase [Blastocatellia bacterium]
MNVEKSTRYVIFGAGAIGAAIGGLLNRAGSRVVCVARPAVAEALARGIVLEEHGEETTVTAEAVTAVGELTREDGDVALITTKSQASEEAVRELSEAYDGTLPVVCLQNGVRNEEIAAARFKTVYAGLVFFSAVQLEPSLITMPQGRTIAIGCYPEGLDDRALHICADLKRAGLEVLPSAHVMSMKWGKLIANLNNATTTITGYWLERAMADSEMRRLMLEVREEGLRVSDAAGIAVEPPASEPSAIRIREMTEKLRQPLKPARHGDEGDQVEEERTYSSMWQDLYLGRKQNEAEFLNGEIIALGRKVGIPTPYNSILLETVNRMFAEGLKPGLYGPKELHALIRSRSGQFI